MQHYTFHLQSFLSSERPIYSNTLIFNSIQLNIHVEPLTLETTTNKYKYTEMYTQSRTVPVSSMFILKLKPYKYMHAGRFANESLRQRPVRQRMKSIRQSRMSVRQLRATITLTRISIIPRSFIHCRAKQTATEICVPRT